MQVVRTYIRRALASALLFSLSACVQDSEPVTRGGDAASPMDTQRQRAVYGNDDRLDYYAHPDAALRKLTRESTVALMDVDDLDPINPAETRFHAATLQESMNLCPDQRFLNDPTPAFCSGTLIDSDLVLTAGHCVRGPASCGSTRFVFNFYRTAVNALQPSTHGDIFKCGRVVVRNTSTVAGRQLDYAIVQLDRPAHTLRFPAPIRTGNSALPVGTGVAVIGTGSGIPFKIDSGGVVRQSRASVLDYFVADTDTFGGNSGSGVYVAANGGYVLAGLVVRGATDYVASPDPEDECNVVNECQGGSCPGESINYVRPAIDAYCAVASSLRLCAGYPPPQAPVTFDFAASNTNGARRNTSTHDLHLTEGQTLYVGTSMVPFATATGDTFLRLFQEGYFEGDFVEVARNDDAYDSLSFIQYTVPETGLYQIRVGCARNSSCAGRAAYVVR